MSSRGIFVPGKGSTVASYTAAVASGAFYPGDWVSINTVVPTSQGVSGVYRGQTLGGADFIECVLSDSDVVGAEAGCLGCMHGLTINAPANWETVTSNVVADGDVVIIQNWGVHPQGAQVTGGTLGDNLHIGTDAGQCVNDVTNTALDVGINLTASSTYTRAAATDTNGAVVFVRCAGA